MIEGERRFKAGFYVTEDGKFNDMTIVFDESSTIKMYDENEELLIASFQPPDIAVIYAAICEMNKYSI